MALDLTVTRFMCGAECTIGQLTVDGEHECYTLEDVVRPAGVKIPGQTAIPYGRYRVGINFSNRFQRDMPILFDVPDFTGVRIHPGNTDADTHGCLLVGTTHTGTAVLNSRAAFDVLFPKIRNAIDNGEEVWITYTNGDA